MILPKRKTLIDIFIKYNQKLNLSAIRDAEGIYVKHILDALELLKALSLADHKGITIADVGTGWWFPLLPLAISFPDISFYGIDSVTKKCNAIKAMCDDLGLTNVQLIPKRIEDIVQSFDIVTARAVAHVEKLIPWVSRLVKPGGKLILYKQQWEEEYQVLLNLAPKYGFSLDKEYIYTLFEWDIKRVIYILSKQQWK